MMIKAMCKRRAALAGLGNRGAALVEFAITVPLLLLVVLGTAYFGLALNNYVMLTNAVGVGAQLFSISAGTTNAPCSNTVSAVHAAAPNLTAANLPITLSVAGTACATSITATSCPAATDTACQTALTNNASNPPTTATATVSATYPCNLNFAVHSPLVNNWAGPTSCTLSAQVTERIQ
jgi:Flp pilus assembly protein TadG